MSNFQYNPEVLPKAKKTDRFGLVVAHFNKPFTDRLLSGAKKGFLACGVEEEHITVLRVPGSLELPFGAQKLIEKEPNIAAVLVLGVVIRGATSHYEHVCDGVTKGTIEVSLKTGVPVILGVITAENEAQVEERIRKGYENAIAAVEMSLLLK